MIFKKLVGEPLRATVSEYVLQETMGALVWQVIFMEEFHFRNRTNITKMIGPG